MYNAKKIYEKASLSILSFNELDVIKTSTGDGFLGDEEQFSLTAIIVED